MFDSNKMFDLGVAFQEAGEINFRSGAIKKASKCKNVAGVVNLAFACELFIKCLLNMEGENPQGHELRDLWAQFKSKNEDEASEIELSVMNTLVTNFTFEEMLNNDSNVFATFRYLYEPENIEKIHDKPLRPQFLRVLSHTLHLFLYRRLRS